jgi:hypothetical protein
MEGMLPTRRARSAGFFALQRESSNQLFICRDQLRIQPYLRRMDDVIERSET